jgi:hypothetical protein
MEKTDKIRLHEARTDWPEPAMLTSPDVWAIILT